MKHSAKGLVKTQDEHQLVMNLLLVYENDNHGRA